MRREWNPDETKGTLFFQVLKLFGSVVCKNTPTLSGISENRAIAQKVPMLFLRTTDSDGKHEAQCRTLTGTIVSV